MGMESDQTTKPAFSVASVEVESALNLDSSMAVPDTTSIFVLAALDKLGGAGRKDCEG
jgi:hypothetical protein